MFYENEFIKVYKKYIMNVINSYEKNPEFHINSPNEIKLHDMDYIL